MAMRQLKISKSITNRESQSLEKYLQEISKVELLQPDEETQLAQAIRNGSQQAIDKLVKANLRFVVSVAKQYQNQGLTLPDLINEGNMGLIKAAMRFDETKGFKFISYAVWWIRQSILQALAEQSRIVRLPLNKVGLTNRISKAYQLLEQQFEREPTPEEIAANLEIDLADVAATMQVNIRHVSVDSPLGEGDDASLVDIMADPNAAVADAHLTHQESLQTEIQRSLKTLSERQKEILCYFFGIGVEHAYSLEDIGHRFNLTRERVRQIKDKALLRLRSAGRCHQLKVYLG